MLHAKSLFASLSFIGVAVAAGCNADNCARAVTGTRAGKAPDASLRLADCSNFLLATVTPAVITSTATVTVRAAATTTLIPDPTPDKAKRASAPEAASPTIPAYASACSNAARYSSACSCFGVTSPGTTTLPAPTTVVTSTLTYGCTNPGICNAIDTHYPCGDCGNGYCLCVLSTDGESFCTPEGESCESLPDCEADADCADGIKCQVLTCCGDNVSKCTPDIAEYCKDPSLAQFIF